MIINRMIFLKEKLRILPIVYQQWTLDGFEVKIYLNLFQAKIRSSMSSIKLKIYYNMKILILNVLGHSNFSQFETFVTN